MFNVKWGIAPIGWRNDDIPEIGAENTLCHILGDVAFAGFEGTEVGGFFPEPTLLNKELELRNLQIAGKWFSSFIIGNGIEQTTKEFREHCQYLSEVHANVAVVSEQTYSIQGKTNNIFTDKPYFTDEEWDLLCDGLNELGKVAQEYGLKLVYHHHMGTVVQTLEEVDRLMDNTDPNYVHLLYDTGNNYVSDANYMELLNKHRDRLEQYDRIMINTYPNYLHLLYDTGNIYVSDENYMDLLNKHIDRIKHVHFKDVRNEVKKTCETGKSFLDSFLAGMFTVPGDGDIDFVPVYKKLQEVGYKGWIVIEAEQDPSIAHPLEYALKAKKYIQENLTVLDNK